MEHKAGILFFIMASPLALVIKNPPANARDSRDVGSIPGLGRSPVRKRQRHSSILARKIPWTEEPSGLQFTGSEGVRHD